MRQANTEFETQSPNGLPSDILPILKYVFYKQEAAARGAVEKVISVTDKMFAQAKSTWTPGKKFLPKGIFSKISPSEY